MNSYFRRRGLIAGAVIVLGVAILLIVLARSATATNPAAVALFSPAATTTLVRATVMVANTATQGLSAVPSSSAPTVPAATRLAAPSLASRTPPAQTGTLSAMAEPQTVVDSPLLVRLTATASNAPLIAQLVYLDAVRAGRFQPIYYATAQGNTPATVLAVISAGDVAQFKGSGTEYTLIDANADTARYYSITMRNQNDRDTVSGLDTTWQRLGTIGDHVFFKVRLPAFVGFDALAGLPIEKVPPRITIPGLTTPCPCGMLAKATFSALPPAQYTAGVPLADTITHITETDLKNVDTQIVQNEVRGYGVLNTRYTGTKGSVYMAERLYTYFFALGLQVHYDTFVEMGLGTVVTNVVGEQPGQKTGASAEPIVITAHYDSLGERNLSGDMNPDIPAFGANDNGTGLAGMLEIARLLMAYHVTQPIRYLATGAEEQGMLGSQHYTANHLHPDIPKANINIDSFGYNTPGTPDWIVLGFNNTGADLKDAIVGYEQKYKIGLRLDVRRGEAFFRSDDYWFDKHGIDSVVMTDSFALQSPNNHTPNDTIANVNFTTTRKVVQLALVTAAEYAK